VPAPAHHTLFLISHPTSLPPCTPPLPVSYRWRPLLPPPINSPSTTASTLPIRRAGRREAALGGGAAGIGIDQGLHGWCVRPLLSRGRTADPVHHRLREDISPFSPSAGTSLSLSPLHRARVVAAGSGRR
jgi:hypothetical protein